MENVFIKTSLSFTFGNFSGTQTETQSHTQAHTDIDIPNSV